MANVYYTVGGKLALSGGKAICTSLFGYGYIAASFGHSLRLKDNGTLWGWGVNSHGSIGDSTQTNKSSPVVVCDNHIFCKITAGGDLGTSLAIDNNGRAWGWGNNQYSQLGNPDSPQVKPISVQGAIKTFCQISNGYYHTLAIDKNGLVWAWGGNQKGELGINVSDAASHSTPISVGGTLKTFCQISCGFFNSIGIDKNGKVWGWGYNSKGQLGNNTVISYNTPISVGGGTRTFCKIAVGNLHSVAIDKTGKAWGWGANAYGRLGDNTTTDKSTPIAIVGANKTFCQISAGASHTLAIDKNGIAWGWGNNQYGQLGNRSTAHRSTPVSVYGSHTFCRIVANSVGNFALAIDNTGNVWAWGNNDYGQLDNNSITHQSTPVMINV